jgi:hypothetical protein
MERALFMPILSSLCRICLARLDLSTWSLSTIVMCPEAYVQISLESFPSKESALAAHLLLQQRGTAQLDNLILQLQQPTLLLVEALIDLASQSVVGSFAVHIVDTLVARDHPSLAPGSKALPCCY